MEDSATAAVGQQVITACAFIHQSFGGVEKVFLPKRADTKKFLPGVYELPGGHIDYGEHVTAGLSREIREELGMEISIGDPFYVYTYLNHIKGSHSIEVVYFARFLGDIETISLHPDDHSTFGWFSREEVQTLQHEIRAGQEVGGYSSEEDPEYLAMMMGFDFLDGCPLRLG